MDNPRHDPAVRAPITVMLVDDDLLVRRIVLELLTRHPDIRVAGVFGCGRDALEAAIADPPGVMVVDIAMPGMDGAELTRLVLAERPQVRILAYTSFADEQSLSNMLNAGASGVVYKEASVSAVADAIRATSAGLSVLSPRFSNRLARPETDQSLTDMEVQILRLISRGMTNEQIGAVVSLSPSTIKYHITKLAETLGASNRVTLAVAAVRLGLDRGAPTSDREPLKE